jgi:hypothetical protein
MYAMTTDSQKKGKTRQVRMRADKADRVERVALKAAAIRDERLNAIDIYDEILEKELPKLEKQLGIE